MKFAVNHNYKFKKRHLAFFAGWLQFSVAISCEILGYLQLLQALNPSDVLSNFLSIYVIIEIDQIFFESLKCIAFKRQVLLIEDELLKITQTTSNEASYDFKNNKVDQAFLGERFKLSQDGKETLPTHIRVNFKERKCGEKFLYCYYKAMRFFDIVIWHYFASFYALYVFFYYQTILTL